MEENTKLVEKPSVGPVTFSFTEPPKVEACSYFLCTNEHKWNPTVGVAKCSGCGAPILSLKMEQCPICNEPSSRMMLRSDHLPQNGAIQPLCRGGSTLAEVNHIMINMQHFHKEQANHVVREMPGKV